MDKEIRLLMGVPSKNIKMGGPTTHLPYLVDYFIKNEKYQIRTFSYGSKIDGGSLIDKKESVLSKVLNSIQVFCLFIFNVIVFRPHIIHINSAFVKNALFRDIPYSIFCFIFRKNLIFKLHGSSYDLINTQNRFYLILIRLFFSGAKKVGVLSEIEKNEFVSKFGNRSKIIVIKNIVLPKNLKNNQEFFLFKKEDTKIYGLFVSRIVKGKGLNDIIKALSSILKTHPTFTLVIAGDGPEKSECINLANSLNVSESIIWLGFVPNKLLLKLISNADIFIFSSHFPEGMPMSLVEALQCGIPIITTRVRFAVNYMVEYENCLFIEAGNISDIADKLNQLIMNKVLQMKMRNSNPRIVEKFSQHLVGKEFEIIYHQMIEKEDKHLKITNQIDSNKFKI